MQRVFIVEHCLASRSYLTGQKEFRDTFPDCAAPQKFDSISSGELFRGTETVYRIVSNMRIFQTINVILFLVSF
jgi:hypothetical protein